MLWDIYKYELNFKVRCNSAGLDGSFGRTWAMGSVNVVGYNTMSINDSHQQGHKTWFKGMNNWNKLFIAFLDILQASLIDSFNTSF